MRRETLAMTAAALAIVSPLAGCESTREQAAKIAAGGDRAFAAKGLRVARADPRVQVLEQAVVSDANGTAAVVVMRNRGAQTLAQAPVAIAVRGAGGRLLARNDAPGLERGLTHVALLPPGEAVTWVNDQLQTAGGRGARLRARVGRGHPLRRAARMRIEVDAVHLEGDATSGITARARATNRSGVAQRNLVIAVVARRGGRIVAAGRAIVPLLRAHGRKRFQAFFIGDPRGAALQFDAQPSTLR